jgi:hypothetical protein
MCVADGSFDMLHNLAVVLPFRVCTGVSVLIRWVLTLWNALHNEAEPRRLREMRYSLLRHITRKCRRRCRSAIARLQAFVMFVCGWNKRRQPSWQRHAHGTADELCTLVEAVRMKLMYLSPAVHGGAKLLLCGPCTCEMNTSAQMTPFYRLDGLHPIKA